MHHTSVKYGNRGFRAYYGSADGTRVKQYIGPPRATLREAVEDQNRFRTASDVHGTRMALRLAKKTVG
jgi:hypothetical protein